MGSPGQMQEDLKSYRHQALVAARDLRYDNKVITAVKKAKSITEISKIMTTARHKACDREIGMSVEAYDALIDREMP